MYKKCSHERKTILTFQKLERNSPHLRRPGGSPSSPIVKKICVCIRRSGREDDDDEDDDDGDDDDDDVDDDEGGGGEEEEEEGKEDMQREKSNNPNLKGGEKHVVSLCKLG